MAKCKYKMQADLNEFEIAELDRLALIDKWDDTSEWTRDRLERLVLGFLREGYSFKLAVCHALAVPPREDDPGLLKKKAAQQSKIDAVAAYKEKRKKLVGALVKMPGVLSGRKASGPSLVQS